MNTKSLKLTTRRAVLPCALLLLGSVLSGCGGGGGSTPATLLQPATVTLSGTLQDPSGAPLAGYRILFTPGAMTAAHARRAEDVPPTISAVTDAHGFYTLSVPGLQVTTLATLTIYDTAGAQVQTQAVTLDPTQTVQTTVTTVNPVGTSTVGTPPPPPVPPV